MSIFSKIMEGLANLDEGYARDKRQSTRERESDERRDRSQADRDERLNKMTLMRDQLLAADQAVRDARLHGNAMDVQKAQIDADRARYEFTNAQENLRQDKDIGFKKEDNKEQRRFMSTEANKERDTMVGEKEKDRTLTREEAAKQRGFVGGESEKDRTHQGTMAEKDRTWKTNERMGSQQFQSTEEREKRGWMTNERRGAEGFQSGESKKEYRRRLKSLERASNLEVSREDAMARNKKRRGEEALAEVFPDNMNPAERENAVRGLKYRSLYDLPLAEAEGRAEQIRATKGGVLYPGYNALLGAREKNERSTGGNPFGTMDTGDTGMTIQDLIKSPDQNPMVPGTKGPGRLRTVDSENLYD